MGELLEQAIGTVEFYTIRYGKDKKAKGDNTLNTVGESQRHAWRREHAKDPLGVAAQRFGGLADVGPAM